jgi:hypothetical protein
MVRSVLLATLVCLGYPYELLARGTNISEDRIELAAASTKKKGKKKRKPGRMRKETAEVDADQTTASDDTTRGIRSRNKYYLGGRISPLYIDGMLGGGFEALYILNGDVQFGGMFGYAFEDYTDRLNEDFEKDRLPGESSTIYAKSFDLSSMNFTALMKYFVGNSFYFGAGLGYRILTFDLILGDEADEANELAFDLGGSAITLDLMIGNQWCFSSFCVGADWVGVVFPLSSSYETSTALSGDRGDIDEIQAIAEKTSEELHTAMLKSLLVLTAGFVF